MEIAEITPQGTGAVWVLVGLWSPRGVCWLLADIHRCVAKFNFKRIIWTISNLLYRLYFFCPRMRFCLLAVRTGRCVT